MKVKGFISSHYYLIQHEFQFHIPDRIYYNNGNHKFRAPILGRLTEVKVISSNRKLQILREEKKMLENAQSDQLRKIVQQGNIYDFDVKRNSKGRGVYTEKSVEKHTFLLEYKGKLLKRNEGLEAEKAYYKKNEDGGFLYFFAYNNKQYCVDATEEDESLGRLVNHSSEPNCAVIARKLDNTIRLFLYSLRNIEVQEELTINYNDNRKKIKKVLPWLESRVEELPRRSTESLQKDFLRINEINIKLRELRAEKEILQQQLVDLDKGKCSLHSNTISSQNNSKILSGLLSKHDVECFSVNSTINSLSDSQIMASTPVQNLSINEEIVAQSSELPIDAMMPKDSPLQYEEQIEAKGQEAAACSTSLRTRKLVHLNYKENRSLQSNFNVSAKKINEVVTSSEKDSLDEAPKKKRKLRILNDSTISLSLSDSPHNEVDVMPTDYELQVMKSESGGYCCYCEIVQTQLARHLMLQHEHIPRIRNISKLDKRSKERRSKINKIRLKGLKMFNLKYHLKIPLRHRGSEVIKEKINCGKCSNFYSPTTIKRHLKKCQI